MKTKKTSPSARAIARVVRELLRSSVKVLKSTDAGLSIMREFLQDSQEYLEHFGAARIDESCEAFRARLTVEYHCIEKALSLEETRAGFGKERVEKLVDSVKECVRRYGADPTSQVAVNALQAYYDFNAQQGIDNEWLHGELEQLRVLVTEREVCCEDGGVIPLTRSDVKNSSHIDFDSFAKTRHSIRHFSSEPVPIELIESAIGMALKTPSVCNRQPWKVHVYCDQEIKQRLLDYQSGNRGFGDKASTILVVTSPLSAFFDVGERHQPYTNGGMFSMSLVYAIHALGLGSCCLNLCKTNKEADMFRQVAGIPDDEALVMMIIVGNLPESFCVAQSHRKSLDKVMVTH